MTFNAEIVESGDDLPKHRHREQHVEARPQAASLRGVAHVAVADGGGGDPAPIDCVAEGPKGVDRAEDGAGDELEPEREGQRGEQAVDHTNQRFAYLREKYRHGGVGVTGLAAARVQQQCSITCAAIRGTVPMVVCGTHFFE